jgi:hypothetical protein
VIQYFNKSCPSYDELNDEYRIIDMIKCKFHPPLPSMESLSLFHKACVMSFLNLNPTFSYLEAGHHVEHPGRHTPDPATKESGSCIRVNGGQIASLPKENVGCVHGGGAVVCKETGHTIWKNSDVSGMSGMFLPPNRLRAARTRNLRPHY